MRRPQPFLLRLANTLTRFSDQGVPLEILELSASRLQVGSGAGAVIFDAKFKHVVKRAKKVLDFAHIDHIEVSRHCDDDDGDYWKVSLYVNFWRRLTVGRTTDDTDASIAAARIAALTGKPVRSL
jgi:hypothetical protein